MQTKRCNVCKEYKSLEDFHLQTKSVDGRQHKCKSCAIVYSKKRHEQRRLKLNLGRPGDPRPNRRKIFQAEDGTWMKQCSKCKEILPETDFKRHSTTGLLKDGITPYLYSRCLVCEAEYQWNYYRQGDNIAKKKVHSRKSKDKMNKLFFENLHGPPIPESMIGYIQLLQAEVKEEVRKRKNRERYHRQKAKDPDAFRARDAAKQRTFHSRRPEYRKAYIKKWLSTERGIAVHRANIRKRDALRRARQAGFKIEGYHTDQEWQELLRVCEYRCSCCGRHQDETPLTRDHVIPLVKGGSDEIWNIQPLCRSCNSMKHADDYRFIPPYEELMETTS